MHPVNSNTVSHMASNIGRTQISNSSSIVRKAPTKALAIAIAIVTDLGLILIMQTIAIHITVMKRMGEILNYHPNLRCSSMILHRSAVITMA